MRLSVRPVFVARWSLAFAWIALFVGTECRAGDRAFRWFTGDDGLAQLSVAAILQDRDGDLWVGTQAGISRYDGVHFATIDTRNGLPNDWINAFAEAPDGSIWVGTNAGVAQVHHDGRVTNTELALDAVVDLDFDRDGTLWFATPEGLFALAEGGTLTEFGPRKGLPSRAVVALDRDADGALYCLFRDVSLFRVGRRGDVEAIVTSGARLGEARALLAAADGSVWIARERGVEIVAPDGSARVLRAGHELVDGRPSCLTQAPDGAVWIGTQEGVVSVHPDGRMETLTVDDKLPFPGVNAIEVDHDGTLWMGGFGGLVVFTGFAFENFTTEHGLPADNVRPILRTSDGTLWVGTNQGLARRVGEGFEKVHVTDAEGKLWVLFLHEDHRGWLWVATNRGLYVRRDDAFEHVLGDKNGMWIDQIVETTGGVLWIARRNRVPMRSRDGIEFEVVEIPGESYGNGRMLGHSDGSLWYTGLRGLSRYDGKNWKTWTVRDGLAAAEPYYLAEGPDRNVWFGYHSSQGFTRFDGKEFRTWNDADGLTSNAVFSLGFDQRGHLWLGHSRGVDRFDGQHFVNYGKPEGYGSAESNAGGFFEDVDGTLWFATAEGLTHYDPARDRPRNTPPRVRFAEVRLDDTPVVDGEDYAHDQRDLHVKVVVPHFDPPKRIETRYRLVGDSNGWQPMEDARLQIHNLSSGQYRLEVQARRYGGPWSESAVRSFAIARPFWASWWFGFVVLAVMYAAIRAALRVRTLRIRQRNAWLQEVVAQRTTELAEKNASLQNAMAALSRTKHELERVNSRLVEADEAKSRFLANMSHEIRTPMNGVIGMTSLLLETNLDDDQKEFVDIVRRSGDQLLGVINDVLDFSKIEAGKLDLEHRTFDLRACAEDAADVLAVKASEKNVELIVSVDPALPRHVVGDVTRLRQVLVNLIGNGVKFTEKGFVWLRVEPDARADHVHFVVRDTGIGIEPERAATLFDAFSQADASTTRKFGGTGLGLAISKQIVDRMDGELRASGTPGEGAVFEFSAALPRDPQDTAPSIDADPSLRGLQAAVLVESDPTWDALVEIAAVHGMTLHRTDVEALAVLGTGAVDLVVVDKDASAGHGLRHGASAHARLGLPVIALARMMDRCDPGAEGVTHCLPKPIKAEVFARTLRKAIDGAPAGTSGMVATVVDAVESGVATQTRVLVAEDDRVSQRVLTRILDQLGYEHVLVADGEQVLEAMATSTFDVVLMDARMPGMDGLEATRRIRASEAGRQPYIVAMTASASDDDREAAYEAGMDEFVGKPVTKSALRGVLARVASGAGVRG